MVCLGLVCEVWVSYLFTSPKHLEPTPFSKDGPLVKYNCPLALVNDSGVG
jgi:hypothetical protein